MKLIVGLGNPGKAYAETRHNIGFQVVKTLAKEYKITLRRQLYTCSLNGRGSIGGQAVVVAIPLTFMNLSGMAAKELLQKHRLTRDHLLVVCDDFNLDFGRLRIRPAGSAGGHNGLKSVIESLRSEDFCRLRIGIGKSGRNGETAAFVLSTFTKQERLELPVIIERAVECCRVWAVGGIADSMNTFNKSMSKETS